MSLFNSNPEEPVYPHKLRRLYWPFLALAEVCREVVGTVAGAFEMEGKRYTLPRFVFHGPASNMPPIRLGFFSLLHGDASAGALGLQHFLNALVNDPEPATGYELTFYPLCNPTGYEDGTRVNRAGYDLSREFWRGSALPEVKIIEEELRTVQFDGIVALRADHGREGFSGYARDPVVRQDLLEPALRASAHVLPLIPMTGPENGAPVGEASANYPGVLSPPPEQRPRPFEVVFETPLAAPMTQQIEAISCALRSVLKEYRSFIAQGANL